MVRVACSLVAALMTVVSASASAAQGVGHLEMDVMDANESPEQAVQRMDQRRRNEEAAAPRPRPADMPAESPAVGDDPLVIRTLDSTQSTNPLATSPDPALLEMQHGPSSDHGKGKDHHAQNGATNTVQVGLNDANQHKDPKPPADGGHKDGKGHGH